MKGNGKSDLMFGGNAVSMIVDEKGNKATMKEAAKFHNQAVNNYVKVLNSKINDEMEEAKKITNKMNTMEIMPINSYVLVKPYDRNPFDKVEVTDSGLYIPSMSDNRTFKNPDSGEDDTEVNLSVQAQVIEVSPSCKYVKEGDVVYYRRVSGVPIPFFRQGFEVVSEQQIQVVINEGLKERFKKLNDE